MTSSVPKIVFVLRESIDGVEVTPDNIGLSRFNEFNQQVADFISGSERLSLDDVRVSVGKGSYQLTVVLTATALAAVVPDLRSLGRQDALGEIDPKRAEVVAKWQASAKSKPGLGFCIKQEIPPEILRACVVLPFNWDDAIQAAGLDFSKAERGRR